MIISEEDMSQLEDLEFEVIYAKDELRRDEEDYENAVRALYEFRCERGMS